MKTARRARGGRRARNVRPSFPFAPRQLEINPRCIQRQMLLKNVKVYTRGTVARVFRTEALKECAIDLNKYAHTSTQVRFDKKLPFQTTQMRSMILLSAGEAEGSRFCYYFCQFCYHLATLYFNGSNLYSNLQANRVVEAQNMPRGTKAEGDSTGHPRGSPGEPLKHSPSPPYNAPNDSLQNTKWPGNPRQKEPAVTGYNFKTQKPGSGFPHG